MAGAMLYDLLDGIYSINPRKLSRGSLISFLRFSADIAGFPLNARTGFVCYREHTYIPALFHNKYRLIEFKHWPRLADYNLTMIFDGQGRTELSELFQL